MVKVKSIKIEQFRTFFAKTEIQIGENLTLIAGQNGTAKSTILGMLCQPLGFSKSESIYTNAYDGIDLKNLTTIGGKSFSARYSEVFRISKKYDLPGTHKYQVYIKSSSIELDKLPDGCLEVESENREGFKPRFVTNTRNREKGAGNFPHPVTYIGLKRLRPLADYILDEVSSQHTLDASDIEYFKAKYSEIFIDLSQISPQKVETKAFKGNYLSIEAATYDSEGASAGQDNIGQILTAILSFRKLKALLGASYQGGMILIDELDATLHPLVQKNVITYLIEESKALDLQIITTTHSLFILEEFNHSKEVVLTYLKKIKNQIHVKNNADYISIWADLTAQIPALKKKNLITVLFEDSIASNFFKEVTGKIFNDYIKIVNDVGQNAETCLSNGFLKTLAEVASKKNIQEFKKILYVLDGDSKSLTIPKIKNLLALPGNNAAEKEMYDLLKALDDDDPFWTSTNEHYSVQICFNNFVNPDSSTTPDFYKKWMKQTTDIVPAPFGQGHNKIFKLWVVKNKAECLEFCFAFLKALQSLNAPLDGLKIKSEIESKYSKL